MIEVVVRAQRSLPNLDCTNFSKEKGMVCQETSKGLDMQSTAMPETCEALDSLSGQETGGPDHFGFYSREILNLFAQSEGVLAFGSEKLNFVGKESGVPKKNDLINISLKSCDLSRDSRTIDRAPLFSEPIVFQLSGFQKQRLTVLVRQSLFSASTEVGLIVDAVLGICRLQSVCRNEENMSKHHEAPKDSYARHDPPKRQKLLPSVEMGDDMRFILGSETSKVEQLVKKHSAQLLARIEHMKQKVEDFANLLLSNFRPMTLTEKQKLQKLIQNLPPKNLNRVVEIIQHGRPCTEEIHVDLEEQSNVTLWRLYFFVAAVESAMKLRKVA